MMKQLQAVLERLPRDVEYTFVRTILAALPPVRETAVWVNDPAATDEMLTAFNHGTYGAVDRLLRRHERALVRRQEKERETARALLDPLRRSLAQLLLAEAHAKAKAFGDCWIERRWVDPDRLGPPSGPCPLSGPGMVIDVWQLGRDRRAHRLAVEGIAAGLPPWGDRRIPWVDPVAVDKLYLALLRRYCRPLFRFRVGHEWRTKRASSGWRVLTLRVIPQLYDYLRPFYPIRRYTTGRREASRGKYPRALLRQIRDLLAAERPDLAADLTEEQVRAVVQRYLKSAPHDRPLGTAMFKLYPKPATGKHTTRPRS
jgi:hypothetical protein